MKFLSPTAKKKVKAVKDKLEMLCKELRRQNKNIMEKLDQGSSWAQIAKVTGAGPAVTYEVKFFTQIKSIGDKIKGLYKNLLDVCCMVCCSFNDCIGRAGSMPAGSRSAPS